MEFALPDTYENRLSSALNVLGFSLARTTELANCILDLSDFYIHENTQPTPWKKKTTHAAHLAYYFPLNYIKCLKVFNEAKNLGFISDEKSFVDFGAGLSPLSLAAKQVFGVQKFNVTAVEVESECEYLTQMIAPDLSIQWKSQLPPIDSSTVVGFSYSLLELNALPSWFFDINKMIIIEPSDRQSGRRLLQLRQKLIANGYYIWAPCTHQDTCPLLLHSKTDWCHDRAHWQMPAWFQKIENHLPMKNHTLTFSYLLASREKLPAHLSRRARLTGDQQKEKGKTKQMVCRSSEREFLVWLDRKGRAPELNRGDLIELPNNLIRVANELRYP